MLQFFYNNIVFFSLVNTFGPNKALLLMNCCLVSCLQIIVFLWFTRNQFLKALMRVGIAVLQTTAFVLFVYGVDQIGLFAYVVHLLKLQKSSHLFLFEYMFIYVFMLMVFLIRQYRMLKYKW